MDQTNVLIKSLVVKLLDDEDGITTDAFTALEDLIHHLYMHNNHTTVPSDINNLLRSVKVANGRCYINK